MNKVIEYSPCPYKPIEDGLAIVDLKQMIEGYAKSKKEFWTDICLYIAKNKLMKPKDYVKFTKFIYEEYIC